MMYTCLQCFFLQFSTSMSDPFDSDTKALIAFTFYDQLYVESLYYELQVSYKQHQQL